MLDQRESGLVQGEFRRTAWAVSGGTIRRRLPTGWISARSARELDDFRWCTEPLMSLWKTLVDFEHEF